MILPFPWILRTVHYPPQEEKSTDHVAGTAGLLRELPERMPDGVVGVDQGWQMVRDLRRMIREVEGSLRVLEAWDNHGRQISSGQSHLLMEVEECQPTSLTTLSDRLRLDPSTVCRTVASLRKAGLIDSTRSRVDGRCCMLSLSPAGESAVRGIHASRDRLFRSILMRIPRQDQPLMLSGLRILLKGLSSK